MTENYGTESLGSGFLEPDARKYTDAGVRLQRTRALSNVSCVSNSTWWSAKASVSGDADDAEYAECEDLPLDIKPMRKVDSGLALENVRERRESVSTTRASSRRSSSSRRHKENEAPLDADRAPKLARHTYASSASAAHPRRRPSTTEAMRSPSQATTLRGCSTRPTSALRSPSSPPASSGSGNWPSWSWDSAEAITEARRRKRREIAESLVQKYPNDRCHGAFLPFNTDFAHSSDSLAPVRFTSAASAAPQRAGSGRRSASAASEPTPMDATTIAWKNMDALRAEYDAADRRKRSAWAWIRQRVLCGGGGILGCGGKNEFWEDGDDDKGSVRRYRLELPDRSGEDAATKVPVRVRSVCHKRHSVRAEDVAMGLAADGADDDASRDKDRWSTVGIMDGMRIDTDFGGLVAAAGEADEPVVASVEGCF